MPARRITWAIAIALALALCGPAVAQERAVFASPGPGSAVSPLSEIIKKDRLDARHGLDLEIKYFDPAAAEQAVLLWRASAGNFAVIAAARANLSGSRVRLFAPALINHNSVLVPPGTSASRLRSTLATHTTM